MAQFNRRSVIKGAAGAAGAAGLAVSSKHSKVFAAPTVLRQNGPMEITYWGFSGALGDSEQILVDQFNESQSDVMVIREVQGNYEETAQRLVSALQAGNQPELCLLSDVWWFRFYLANTLQPLDDLMAANEYDADDLQDSLRNEGIRQGVQYWLPFARSTPLFYYNVDMFEEAGVELPETWTEFEEIAPSLVEGNRLAFAHPTGASYVAWLFQGVTWAFGGEYSDADFNIKINEPGAVAAGEFYRRSVEDGWAYVSQDLNVDFTNGLTASMMASTGSLAAINALNEETGINFRTAFLRKEQPEIEQVVSTGGAGLSIMTGLDEDRQQAAFEYIQYVTSTDVTAQWSQLSGYMPVRKSAVESETMQEYFERDPNARTAVEQLAVTKQQDAARVFIPGGDQIIGEGLERITLNFEDVQSVFDDVAATLTEEAQPVIEQVEEREG